MTIGLDARMNIKEDLAKEICFTDPRKLKQKRHQPGGLSLHIQDLV